ncbi:unnamed protein product [Prorocentrum cordatum]|uniref:Glutaredoxin domain-containing protein n=1 Tax=Prorocentrum cordatum TaxID=2364126 RepID=A0ABN9QNS2_9DINO|nr:unnamed protein product [Polarella glacialis]
MKAVPGAPWPRRRRPLRPAAAPRARHPALAAACLVAAATGRAAFLRLPAAPLRPCRRAMAAGAAALLAGELLAGCGGACVAAAAVQLEMPGGSNDCPDCTISGAPGLASVGAGPEAERGWGDRVSRLVSQNRVMVFSKSWCPYCARAKGALAEEGVQFEALELDRLPPGEMAAAQRALAQLTGASTVPRVFVGGRCIGGGDDTVRMQKSGELARLLDEVRQRARGSTVDGTVRAKAAA